MVRHFVNPVLQVGHKVTGFVEKRRSFGRWKDVQRDIWYIEHWTFLLDLYIMYKTVYNVIRGDKEAY